MYPELLAHVGKYVSLSAMQQQQLCNKLEFKSYKKKQLVLEPGMHCPGYFFVLSGLVRQYYVNKKLNEQVIQFGLENWWITDQDSLLNHVPAQSYLQTIEDSNLLLLTKRNQAVLFSEIPQLETYFHIMTQRALIAAHRRIGFIFNLTDEERYFHFIKLFPDFVQRIPQYMLASYLGFTPQFLSRLRAKNSLIS